MTDLSTPGPVVRWSEEWWANAKPEVRAHRCTAHRKNGDRCKRAAIQGGRVCTQHGGSARPSKPRPANDSKTPPIRWPASCSRWPLDENVSDAVKLAAIRDALDRAGLSARTAVSVEIGRRPFEQIFDQIYSGSRAESRRWRGMPDDELIEWHPPALAGSGDVAPVMDAELVEPGADCTDTSPTSTAVRSSGVARRSYT